MQGEEHRLLAAPAMHDGRSKPQGPIRSAHGLSIVCGNLKSRVRQAARVATRHGRVRRWRKFLHSGDSDDRIWIIGLRALPRSLIRLNSSTRQATPPPAPVFHTAARWGRGKC